MSTVNGKAWELVPQVSQYPAGPLGSGRLSADRLGMTQSTATGFCGNVFGVTEDENPVRERELIKFTINYLDDIRYGIAETFATLIGRDLHKQDNDILRMFMTLDHWSVESETEAKKTFGEQEKQLQLNLESYLIKELLSSSRCFVECNEVTNIDRFCPKTLTAKQEKSSVEFQHRFCPDGKTVCKAECMAKKQYWNDKLPIISYEKLSDYNSSLGDLMEKSWKHYNLPESDPYSVQSLVTNGKHTQSDELLHLPVCYSTSDTIGTFNKAHKYQKRFPFSCGRNFTSADTPEFFKEINVLTAGESNTRIHRVAEV